MLGRVSLKEISQMGRHLESLHGAYNNTLYVPKLRSDCLTTNDGHNNGVPGGCSGIGFATGLGPIVAPASSPLDDNPPQPTPPRQTLENKE